MEQFGAVIKLDWTEETRTQLQEEEAITSSFLILAAPIDYCEETVNLRQDRNKRLTVNLCWWYVFIVQ